MHHNPARRRAEEQSLTQPSLIGPTRVWLLRHAESAAPTVFHGAESDVALSERGQRQAETLARLLAAERPDAVVSSAMRRAVHTALPLARSCGLALRQEPDLHERRVGALSGQPFQALEGLWPETLRRWLDGDTSYAPPGAESFDAIAQRVLPVWRRLTAEFAGRSLAIVAHGVVCKVLLLHVIEGWTVADWQRLGPIHNVGITELRGTGSSWQLVRFNEIPPVMVAL